MSLKWVWLSYLWKTSSGIVGSRQVMRLGFRCDESVYIDITRYFFMTTTY